MFFASDNNQLKVTQKKLFDTVILPLLQKYSGIIWFADEGVYATSEGMVCNSLTKSWTSWLIKANKVSDTDKRYIELERMLHSVVCFYLLISNEFDLESVYRYWTQAQGNNSFSKDSLNDLRQLCKELTPTDIKAIEASLVYSDLGKTPIAKERLHIIIGDSLQSSDHDDFITYLYSKDSATISKVIPDFDNLEKEVQLCIRQQHAAITLHWGHVFHLEGGVAMFENFLQACSQYCSEDNLINNFLKQAYLIQICDVAASKAHENLDGFIAFNQATYLGYKMIFETIKNLLHTKDPKQSLLYIIHQKAIQLGYLKEQDLTCKQLMVSKEEFLLTRLGAFLRLSTIQEGKLLQQAAENIEKDNDGWTSNEWLILEELFGFDSGINTWQRNPTYMPALIGVLFNSVKEETQKYKMALHGFLILAKIAKKCKEERQCDERPSPLCFNSLAHQVKESKFLQLFFDSKSFNVNTIILTEKNEAIIKEDKLLLKL